MYPNLYRVAIIENRAIVIFHNFLLITVLDVPHFR